MTRNIAFAALNLAMTVLWLFGTLGWVALWIAVI